MILWKKNNGASKPFAGLIDATAAEVELTVEKGESFELITPAGKLNVERTQDTFMITCEDGFVAFDAQMDGGVWTRTHPPKE